MRPVAPILIAAFLMLPATVIAGEGDPRENPCHQRERNCTDVLAGTMECMPAKGIAEALSSVVGSADSGTFNLKAKGTNLANSASVCTFEIRIDAANVQFNEGWTVGLLAPYGGITSTTTQPCTTLPGQTCESTATFTWWRAQHGVTFDVPFDLVVNGIVVAKGKCHYYDPPMMEEITGGPVSL